MIRSRPSIVAVRIPFVLAVVPLEDTVAIIRQPVVNDGKAISCTVHRRRALDGPQLAVDPCDWSDFLLVSLRWDADGVWLGRYSSH